jgi:stage VI sporulation protein D
LDQSYLRFSLEEAIWFKKGQEVQEFLSVSLDPVISVDEYEHYITIRGALELSGEYRMADDEEGEDVELYDFGTHRFIQHIETREDGITELFHRFPVDITIPKNRIVNLEDVYVTIESFDYDLGQDGRLSLMADISISGISEDTDDEAEDEDGEPWFEPFETVARKELYDEEYEDEYGRFESSIHAENEENLENHGWSNENAEQDNEHWNPIFDQAEENEETEPEFENHGPLIANNENNEAPEHETKVSIGASKHEDQENHQAVEGEETKKQRKENALYLTQLFSKDQAEDFSRLKICIVQQGDSMDKIAQRYDLSIQQILRANQLDYEAELREGQLLYIPVPANSRP